MGDPSACSPRALSPPSGQGPLQGGWWPWCHWDLVLCSGTSMGSWPGPPFAAQQPPWVGFRGCHPRVFLSKGGNNPIKPWAESRERKQQGRVGGGGDLSLCTEGASSMRWLQTRAAWLGGPHLGWAGQLRPSFQSQCLLCHWVKPDPGPSVFPVKPKPLTVQENPGPSTITVAAPDTNPVPVCVALVGTMQGPASIRHRFGEKSRLHSCCWLGKEGWQGRITPLLPLTPAVLSLGMRGDTGMPQRALLAQMCLREPHRGSAPTLVTPT